MKISKPYKNIFRSLTVALVLLAGAGFILPPAVTYAASATAPICGKNNTYVPTIDPVTGEVTATGRCKDAPIMCKDSNGNPGPCTDTATTCKGANGQQVQCDFIGKYANPFITFLSAVAGLIATISIVVGGIQYVSSEGDPQKVTEAKKRISNSVLAIVGFLLLYPFLQYIIPGGYLNG